MHGIAIRAAQKVVSLIDASYLTQGTQALNFKRWSDAHGKKKSIEKHILLLTSYLHITRRRCCFRYDIVEHLDGNLCRTIVKGIIHVRKNQDRRPTDTGPRPQKCSPGSLLDRTPAQACLTLASLPLFNVFYEKDTPPSCGGFPD